MRRALMLLAALWPAVYIAFFMALVVEAALRSSGDPDDDLLIPFGVLIVLHVATMLVMLGAAIAYVVHAWRNRRLDKEQRFLWVLVLLLGAPVAMPIYWWLYVRQAGARAPGERAAPTTS